MTRLSYRQVLAVLAPNAQHVMQHILSKANKSTSLSSFRYRFSQVSIRMLTQKISFYVYQGTDFLRISASDSRVRQGPDNFDVQSFPLHSALSTSLDTAAVRQASADPLLPPGPLERSTSPQRGKKTNKTSLTQGSVSGNIVPKAAGAEHKSMVKEFEWSSGEGGGKGQPPDAPDELLLRTLLQVQQVRMLQCRRESSASTRARL
jgi:hypothetical protein